MRLKLSTRRADSREMALRQAWSAPFGEKVREGRRDDQLVSRGLVVESGPQHRARQELRAAEQLSRAVVEMLDEGVVVTDGDMSPVSWNASALKILGTTPAGMKEHGALGDPATLRDEYGEPIEPDQSPISRAFRARSPVHATLRRRLPEGERWLNVLTRPIGGGKPGDLPGLVCTIADVTGSVEAEGRLREERDRARRYLEVASTLVVVLDSRGDVELINRQGCEMLGFAEEEIVGEDWFDMVIPRVDRLPARLAFTQLVSGVVPPVESVETFVQTNLGENRKIAWRNALLRDPEGNVVSVLRSGEDVTDRRRAEEQVAYLAYHDLLTGLPNRAHARGAARTRRRPRTPLRRLARAPLLRPRQLQARQRLARPRRRGRRPRGRGTARVAR